MGVEIRIEDLTKRFGSQTIWEGVTCTIPTNEVSVMLGPSGTGKSVLLKHLIGLLKPTRGHIFIDNRDITTMKEKDLYEIRKLFGVLFQDGALFGSMNIFDNTAFPLREHTRKSESEIKNIVQEKLEITGLIGSEKKLPGEISGGMRKRAGLARALVLDPEILLFDEPDSGLDPVRTAYLNQLIIDLNAQINATMLIVTHDINTARTVPDNIGLLYRRHLAMFGPREMLLSSTEPVVLQFLNAKREGPIGMAEEKDAAELAAEGDEELPALPPIPPQLGTSDGSFRPSARPAGAWLRENGVTPPPGSYMGEGDPKKWGLSNAAEKADGDPADSDHQPAAGTPRRVVRSTASTDEGGAEAASAGGVAVQERPSREESSGVRILPGGRRDRSPADDLKSADDSGADDDDTGADDTGADGSGESSSRRPARRRPISGSPTARRSLRRPVRRGGDGR